MDDDFKEIIGLLDNAYSAWFSVGFDGGNRREAEQYEEDVKKALIKLRDNAFSAGWDEAKEMYQENL